MLSFANMLHLLPYKFACLGRRRFAFARILPSPFDCFLFWHDKLVSLQKVRLVVRRMFFTKRPSALKTERLGIYAIFLITWRNATLYLCSMLG